MQISCEQFVRSCRATGDSGNLIHVLLYREKEWVAHCYGIITDLKGDALVFRSRGRDKEISIDLRNLVFDTNGPWSKLYRSWRLFHPDGWSWDVIDLESAENPEMCK